MSTMSNLDRWHEGGWPSVPHGASATQNAAHNQEHARQEMPRSFMPPQSETCIVRDVEAVRFVYQAT